MPLVERIWKWQFAASPEVLWPLLADTGRLNEAVGFARYTLTETPRPDGTVERIGTSKRLGMTLTWEEDVPEWVWGRRYRHTRRFKSRLVRTVTAEIEFRRADAGTDVQFRLAIVAAWPVALALSWGGMRGYGKTIDRLFREAAGFAEAGEARGFSVPHAPVTDAVRRRVLDQAKALTGRGHPAAERLATHLLDAPETELERMRPRKLARLWQVSPRKVIETCLAAVREGVLTLRWDLVCPRCRGAKVT